MLMVMTLAVVSLITTSLARLSLPEGQFTVANVQLNGQSTNRALGGFYVLSNGHYSIEASGRTVSLTVTTTPEL